MDIGIQRGILGLKGQRVNHMGLDEQRQQLLDEKANLNTLYILKEQLQAWWESEAVELM